VWKTTERELRTCEVGRVYHTHLAGVNWCDRRRENLLRVESVADVGLCRTSRVCTEGALLCSGIHKQGYVSRTGKSRICSGKTSHF